MKLKPHIVPHIDLRDGSGSLALSSAEASLYCGEAFVLRLGRKKKRARGARFPSSPARFLFFSIIDILMGIPSGSLCRGERVFRVLKYVYTQQNF